jgi:NTP pyrophosphatase (non-canonical NTP hydrolase)
MDQLEQIRNEIRQFCQERDWDQFHTPRNIATSLALEANEVLEVFQWKLDDSVSEQDKKQLADELADVLYWTVRMSDKLGLDLVQSFKDKMEKNAGKYPVEKAKGNSKKYTEHV